MTKQKSLFLFPFAIVLQLLLLTSSSFAQKPTIKWVTWEQAIESNKTVKKKIVVDAYTDWCGWCKVMDRKTFADSAVAAYMNENFYCVKLNAEQKDSIVYKGYTFKYRPEYKTHELAISLLNSEMSYPSFVFLNEQEQRITVLKGYYEASAFLQNLKAIAEFNGK
jgi:thioredoxin-related protein